MTKAITLEACDNWKKIRAACNAQKRRTLVQSFVTAIALSTSSFTQLVAQTERTAGDYDDTVVHWPRLDFVIPFNVDVTGQAPREIQLEFSENGGKSWSLYSSGDVRTKQFHFQAKVDGEYQFRLKTLDNQGRSFDNPGEPLRVLVDTTKPDARLFVDIDQRGVMQAEFEIADAALDTSTIQLAYQTESVSQWREIPVELNPGQSPASWLGSGSWNIPSGTRQLVVRLTAKDKAGNPIEITRLPQLPRSASAMGGLQLASGKTQDAKNAIRSGASAPVGSGLPEVAPDSLPRVEVLGAKRSASTLDPTISTTVVALQQLIEQQNKFITSQQSAHKQAFDESQIRGGIGSAGGRSIEEIGSQQFNAPRFEGTERIATPMNQSTARSDSRASKLPVRTLSDEEYEQLTSQSPMSLAAKRTEQSLLVPEDASLSHTPGASLEIEPKVKLIPGQTPFHRDIKPLYSSSKAFSLDYNIDNDPDSPISSVELWGTSDEGQTWQMWGQDPDRASPFDIEVESEGLFGFRMVIVGANGLASNRPRNGDNADAWIHVDIEKPQAKLISALYGKGKESGSMIIEYRASDDYFSDRPITLSYSQTPTGPWTTIATGVRNNSRYVWPADPSLPTSIYLRIEAHDAAGNVGVNQLDLPIDVEGLAPRGRIQGFRPIK